MNRFQVQSLSTLSSSVHQVNVLITHDGHKKYTNNLADYFWVPRLSYLTSVHDRWHLNIILPIKYFTHVIAVDNQVRSQRKRRHGSVTNYRLMISFLWHAITNNNNNNDAGDLIKQGDGQHSSVSLLNTNYRLPSE